MVRAMGAQPASRMAAGSHTWLLKIWLMRSERRSPSPVLRLQRISVLSHHLGLLLHSHAGIVLRICFFCDQYGR